MQMRMAGRSAALPLSHPRPAGLWRLHACHAAVQRPWATGGMHCPSGLPPRQARCKCELFAKPWRPISCRLLTGARQCTHTCASMPCKVLPTLTPFAAAHPSSFVGSTGEGGGLLAAPAQPYIHMMSGLHPSVHRPCMASVRCVCTSECERLASKLASLKLRECMSVPQPWGPSPGALAQGP